jgi:hypothetical protein
VSAAAARQRRRLAPGLAAVAAIALVLGPQSAAAKGWPGHYRVAEGPDIAGELELRKDGRFAYVLAAGALDEHAEGSWREDGSVVRLTTQPKPRPAVFTPAAATAGGPGPVKIHVNWPNGNGIAGVDFRVGFAAGDPLEGYTQDYGWEAPEDETRQPLWIELEEPVNGVVSPRFPIPAGQHALTFILTPNDLGTTDFEDAALERTDKGLALSHPRGGQLHFVTDN